MTSASLNSRTAKDLAEMARKRGVDGWHSMRKEQLVRALLRLAKAKPSKSRPASAKPAPVAAPSRRAMAKGKGVGAKTFKPTASVAQKAAMTPSMAKQPMVKQPMAKPPMVKGSMAKPAPPKPAPPKPPRDAAALARIAQVKANLERARNLSLADEPSVATPAKEKLVVMVRGPHWLHVYWEMTRGGVERARAALSQDWHTAKPVLRLFQREAGQAADSVERVIRDIPIHGGVNNWYIDVHDPPKTYRVEIGYVTYGGSTFYSLARSNIVTTPKSGKRGPLDENWLDVAADYDRIFAMSGGYEQEGDNAQLRELFEERLKKPLGSPMVTRYGNGARAMLPCEERFEFEIDAQMVVFGTTRPDAYVTLRGEPIRIRDDGTFSIRLPMPEAREVLPIIASSSDGVEQRTVIISIDRNTKVLEPVVRDVGQ